MIRLLDQGAYVLNGQTIIEENSEALEILKGKTGKDVRKEEAGKTQLLMRY